jgi:hypothetical protein
MSKEGDQQSFYCVLYKALTDRMPLSTLLEHPKFQNRGRRLCYRVAGKENGEDLFQEACLRVLDAGDLSLDKIPSERDFFSWFYIVARKAYLEQMRKKADLKICTDKTKQWPDALADVPPLDMDTFLNHADVCLYHAYILRAGEEKIRAVFHRARGFDAHGRILRGAKLQAAIAEHERRSKIWREDAQRKELPFNCIALYNDGKKIASCGKFFGLRIHTSLNELNTKAGLQIRAIGGRDTEEDVLLGFYALTGVRHDKDKEHLLDLDNGYTVGLKVKQLSEKNFEIHFRCIETKVIEEEQAQASDDVNGDDMTEEVHSDSSPVSHRPSDFLPLAEDLALKPGSEMPPPINWRTGALCATLSVLFLITITVGGMVLSGSLAKNANAQPPDKRAPTNSSAGQTSDANAPSTARRPGNINSAPDKKVENQTTSRLDKPPSSASPRQPKRLPSNTVEVRSDGPEAKIVHVQAADSNSRSSDNDALNPSLMLAGNLDLRTPPSDDAAPNPPKGNNQVTYNPTPKPTPLQLICSAGEAWSADTSGRVALKRTSYSSTDTTWPTKNTVLFIVDPRIGSMVVHEIKSNYIPVKIVKEQDPPSTKYTIEISLLSMKDSSEGSQATVVLAATISKGNEKTGGSIHPYDGVGSSLELARKDAVRKVIPRVFSELPKESESAFGSFNNEFEETLCQSPGRFAFSFCQPLVSAAISGEKSGAGKSAADNVTIPNVDNVPSPNVSKPSANALSDTGGGREDTR